MTRRARYFDRCIERRPDDPDVWRVGWTGGAGEKLDEFRKRLGHLQADRFTEEQRLSLRAWLSSRVGNTDAERRALEQMMMTVHDSWAMDRLALLAWNAGQTERSRDYRRRKAELDATKDRYRQMMDESLTPDHFVELATLAEAWAAGLKCLAGGPYGPGTPRRMARPRKRSHD